MEASELRIGNLVIFNGAIEKINLIDGDCGLIGSESLPLFEIDESSPIPLTEEWLLKAGFEKDSILFRHPKIKRLCLGYLNNGKIIVLLGGVSLTCYHEGIYVHQLQNLCHSLTGNELKFNLCQSSTTK